MTCAKRRQRLDDTGREAHHQERGFDRRFFCFWAGGRSSRRGRGTHEEITVMGLIQSDRVCFGGVEGGVGASDESATDGNLGSQTDDCTGYV